MKSYRHKYVKRAGVCLLGVSRWPLRGKVGVVGGWMAAKAGDVPCGIVLDA